MSLLGIATEGHLQNGTPLCIATSGFLCGGVVEQPIEAPSEGGGGSKRHYDEIIRQRILRDDQEIMELAQMIIASGVLDEL